MNKKEIEKFFENAKKGKYERININMDEIVDYMIKHISPKEITTLFNYLEELVTEIHERLEKNEDIAFFLAIGLYFTVKLNKKIFESFLNAPDFEGKGI